MSLSTVSINFTAPPAADRAEQIARAEKLAAIAEKNAAIREKGAAQRAGTCPWGAGSDVAETASTPSSRQQSARNTCPWGTDGSEAVPAKPKKVLGKAPQNTCPWGNGANDMHTAMLADAARRRQRPSPSHFGAAGSGAPKVPPKMFPRSEEASVTEDAAPPRAEYASAVASAEATLRGNSCPQPAPASSAEDPEIDDDEQDQEQQREIINQCLAEGLSEDQIMEILDEWQNAKLLQRTQEKLQRGETQPPAQPQALGVSGASMPIQQAEAAGIAGVLKEHTKENVTLPESVPNALSLAAKRRKDRETSEAAVGAFDSDKSRAAYLQSKNQMAAVKSKQRNNAGIF